MRSGKLGTHGKGSAPGREPPDEPGTKRHVWTTPSKQGGSGVLRRGRVRSCVRPTLRGLWTAGPDAIRSLAPKQIYALEWRITLDGFFQAPGLTGSPSRHHRPPHPSAVATADGVQLHPKHQHVPGLGIAPGAELVAPCRVVLRTAQAFRLIGRIGGGDRTLGHVSRRLLGS